MTVLRKFLCACIIFNLCLAGSPTVVRADSKLVDARSIESTRYKATTNDDIENSDEGNDVKNFFIAFVSCNIIVFIGSLSAIACYRRYKYENGRQENVYLYEEVQVRDLRI